MRTLYITSGVRNVARRARRGAASLRCAGEPPAPLNRSTNMTKVKTARGPRKAPVATATEKNDVRPFQVHVPDSALTDLRRRLRTTRWPEKETVTDESQGVPLGMIQELARHWGTDYDW